MHEITRRIWAEIHSEHLLANYRELRSLLPENCRFMAMVKADAYGHGAVKIAQLMENAGADYLGVACLSEALELRKAGILTPILILGYTDPDDAETLIEHKISQTVFDFETAKALSDRAVTAGRTITVHMKVDTGMSRLGFLCADDPGETAGEVERAASLPGLSAEGIFTHFAAAETDEEFTNLQFERFMTVLTCLEKTYGRSFLIRHCANSAAVLKYSRMHLDMVRPGIALYGCYPDPSLECAAKLCQVMELKAKVIAVRDLPAGSTVSYGRTHVFQNNGKTAVLAAGYGDGLPRICSDSLPLLIRGQETQILGRICMDLCMADATKIPDLKTGEVATLFGWDHDVFLSIERAAKLAGTISYELLCSVSKRVPRLYC